MDSFYSEIGGRVKAVRKALRLTQANVAEGAGIDTSFYGQIERGANVPSLKTFVAIAAALKINPADLLTQPERGQDRLYETAMVNLLEGMDHKRKALMLGLLKDIAAHYKAR